MPSTFSTTLRLELPGNGEQSGLWGQTLNKDLNLVEQSIAGISDIYLTGGTYTLSSFNGLEDESRNAILSCSGLLAAPANVVAPSVQKTYIVTNNAGANVTIKTSTGNGVTVLNGTSSLVYCDGTDFYTAVSLNNVIGNQTISGNEVVGANVTAGGNLTVTSNVTSFNGNLTFTSNTSVVNLGTNTGAYTPPTGTTAQRPASPIGGMSRFNTDVGAYEIFNGAVWQPITGAYAVNYVLVAGGGSGGATRGGGGGGAGGYLANSTSVQPGTSYAIVIGAGGTGAVGGGTNGSNSSFNASLVSIGGGTGGGNYYGANASGQSGGSGGGSNNDFAGQLPLGNPGSGTSGQGNSGYQSTPSGQQTGGGGGGAGEGGGVGVYRYAGGNGTSSTITGAAIYYAGGGGGGGGNNESPGERGVGGLGGGGNGGPSGLDPAYAGSPGTANTGGGGGGSGGTLGTPTAGGNGGSGVCILSYPSTTQRATGGTVTTYTSSGTVYWVHTFTTSGTFTA